MPGTTAENRVSLLRATAGLRGIVTVEVFFTGLTSVRDFPTDRERASYGERA